MSSGFAVGKLPMVYLGLVFLRICFALFGTGYIHPDEYFQNGEVVAGTTFPKLFRIPIKHDLGQTLDLHNLLTWEWEPFFPCRSIVPAWVTTGIPFAIVRALSRGAARTNTDGDHVL